METEYVDYGYPPSDEDPAGILAILAEFGYGDDDPALSDMLDFDPSE